MIRPLRTVSLIASAVLLLNVAGCATNKEWAVSGGNRADGVVRVSYEYPEFKQPTLKDEQALRIAANRCNGWGYDAAEPVAGQVRQCSNMDGSNCDLWKVTREYRCTADASFAGNLSK